MLPRQTDSVFLWIYEVDPTLVNNESPDYIYWSWNKSEPGFKSKPTAYNRRTNEVEACTNTGCHNICSGVPTVTDDKSFAQVWLYFCILENTNMIKLSGFTGVVSTETPQKRPFQIKYTRLSQWREHKGTFSQ